MDQVRVGFIGVGGMAQTHMRNLGRMELAKITAVFDIDRERADQVATAYGSAVYGSFEELADSGSVDAVYICTPPFARGDLEEKAALRGLPFLSGKPVGLNMEQVRGKERVIRESGVIHSTGYCLRYTETARQARQYLQHKPVDMILGYRIGGVPGIPWWRLIDKSGGQLVEQATHQVDLIRYLVGEFQEVQAYQAQRHILEEYPEATISDFGVLSFRMRSGAVGSFCNSCMSKHVVRSDVELIGRDFYVSLNSRTLIIRDGIHDQEIHANTEYILEQDRAFIEAVRTGNQNLVLCDYSDAAATLEVTLAANKSADTGRAVQIGG